MISMFLLLVKINLSIKKCRFISSILKTYSIILSKWFYRGHGGESCNHGIPYFNLSFMYYPGSMMGTFHRQLMKDYEEEIHLGTVMVLRQVNKI